MVLLFGVNIVLGLGMVCLRENLPKVTHKHLSPYLAALHKPCVEHCVTPSMLCPKCGEAFHRYSPVSIPQGFHLFPNDACKQRASAGPQQKGFSQASHPDVDVVCVLVQLHDLVDHGLVGNGPAQLSWCFQA